MFCDANGVACDIYPTTSFAGTSVTGEEDGHIFSAQIITSYPSVSCRLTGVSLFTSASVMAYHTMPFAVWPEHTVDRSSVLTESWRRYSEARPLGQGEEFPRFASIQLSMNTEEIYPLTYIDADFFSFFTKLFAPFYKKFTIPLNR